MAKRFGALPERAAGDRRLKLSHFRVLLAASARANRVGEPAWAPLSRLAELTGMEVREVRRTAKDLETFGYLKRAPRFGAKGDQVANAYMVILDQDLPLPTEGGKGVATPGGGRGSPPPGGEGSISPGGPGVHDPREGRGSPPPPSRVDSEDSTQKKLPSSSTASQEARVRGALPGEYHPQLEAYLHAARFPASLLASIWALLDPERSPHFTGAIVGESLRQMQAEGDTFKASRLAKWCANLAADVKAQVPADGEGTPAPRSPLSAAALAAFSMLPGTEAIRAAFERLTVRYGNKKALEQSAFKVIEAWRDDLKNVKPEELEAAIGKYIASDAHQWPKVSEIRQLVRAHRGEQLSAAASGLTEPPKVEGCAKPGCDCGGPGWYLGPDGVADLYANHDARALGLQPTDRPSMRELAEREVQRR